MSDDREPVHMLIADVTRPESISAVEEFAGAGEVADRIQALGESGSRFVAVIPLPGLKDLVSLQRIIIDLATNLGIVAPAPLELDDAIHKVLLGDLDMQVLQAGDGVGHA